MELTPQEKTQLAAIFGCAVEDIGQELERYAAAAQEEYIRMILGQRVFTRGQDVREYRLVLMIRHAFGGRLPSETEVSARFQTTASQSRALLRAVISKYQYELHEPIQESLKAELAAAVEHPEVKGGRILTVDSENVVDAFNRILASIDGTLPPVSRVRNSVSTFELQPSTYQALRKHFE